MSCCPASSALGYRFHRHPCPLAGQIEDLRAPTHRADADVVETAADERKSDG